MIPFFGVDDALNQGLSGNKTGVVEDYGFCGTFDGQGFNIKGLVIENDIVDNDSTEYGYIHQVGGFIGMLTNHAFGSKTVYGTIRNISFTDIWHGRIDNNGLRYGTKNGFLFSVAHGMVVENINLEVTGFQFANALLGSKLWYTQSRYESVLRNIMVHVKTCYSNKYNTGNLWEIDEQGLIFGWMQMYSDAKTFENVYSVVEKVICDSDSDVREVSGYSAPLYELTRPDTVPADWFSAFTGENSLAAYLGESGHTDRKNNWDEAYWDFSTTGEKAGTPVFKTKQ